MYTQRTSVLPVQRARERKRKLMRDSRESESGCKETWAGDEGKKKVAD